MDSLIQLIHMLGISYSELQDLGLDILIGCCIIGIVVVLCSIKTSLDKEKYGDEKVWVVNRICRAIRNGLKR